MSAETRKQSPGPSYLDTLFRVQDNSDPTKEMAFELSSVATGTTRTFTIPDEDGTLALVANVLALAGGTMAGDINVGSQDLTFINHLTLGGATDAAGSTMLSRISSDAKLNIIFSPGDLGGGTNNTTFDFEAAGSGTFTYIFPNVSGTLALTSDITKKTKLFDFTPAHGEPPATDFAQIGMLGTRRRLSYDDTTVETMFFTGVMPSGYNGGTIRVWIECASVPITGNYEWRGYFSDIQAGIAADSDTSYATAQIVIVDASDVASKVPQLVSIDFTQAEADSIQPNEPFRFKIDRNTATASDMTGDAMILRVWAQEV